VRLEQIEPLLNEVGDDDGAGTEELRTGGARAADSYIVGENVLIFGAGPVGRAGAACAKLLGAGAIIVAPNPRQSRPT
jgi:threonine dehydrogenase-like Zn-dependent dehydrogenase